MNRTTIILLRILIAILVTLLFFCQIVVIPRSLSTLALVYPDLGSIVVAGIGSAIVFVLCAQVLLVCVWRLASLARADRIFSDRAFVWVDIALGAVLVATALVVLALVLLQSAGANPPSIALLCVIGIVVGAGLAMLIVLMRGLLRKASQLERDLSEVV